MRHSRPFAAALLFTCLVVAGCGARGTSVTSAPAAPTPSAGALSDSATTGASPVTPVDAAKTPACTSAQGWGTGARQRAPYSSAPLYHVRAGRHACYDRVVFDVNGPAAVGYAARYVKVVQADGSGMPVPVAGSAALEVIIHASAQGTDDQGHQPWKVLAKPGQDFYSPAQLAGWRTLRQVRSAGSFEGQTTIAVGARSRVPFRVFTVPDTRNQLTHVVVDLAH
jgi:hypothetical protein